MKKILLAAVAVAVSSPAMAADDSFQVNAQVAPTCTMENVRDVNLGQLSISTTAGSGALLLANDASSQTNQFWVSCNNTNLMTLTGDQHLVGDRALQSTDDAGFTDKLNYQVAAVGYRNTGAQPSFSSITGSQNQADARGPIHRRVRIAAEVRAADNELRPLAGNYSGTVTVTVTAS